MELVLLLSTFLINFECYMNKEQLLKAKEVKGFLCKPSELYLTVKKIK
jgi:hypothetical protein